MRILTSYIFRSLCALLIGFLLVCNPTEMTTLIVQIIGGLFVLSGLFAIIGYFVSHRRLLQTRERLAALSEADGIYVPSIPAVYLLVGLGSMALGVVLILWPHLFIDILMYLLGALLVLTGIYQIVTMFTFRKVAPLSFSLFLLPAVIAAAGGFILFYPLESASLPFTLLGIFYICYGATEFFYGLRLQHFQKQLDTQLTEIQDVSDAEFEEVPQAHAI